MKMNVSFGALSEPLHKQLGLSRNLCRGAQTLADSIVHLAVSRLITESQARVARQKLMKRLLVLKANFGQADQEREP